MPPDQNNQGHQFIGDLEARIVLHDLVAYVREKKMTPTKHEGCELDSSYCYDHNESMEDGDMPNGAIAYNRALSDILSWLESRGVKE